MYAEAEILREGNEKLLNNLKEGVVIIEENSRLVTFVNKAAKRFKIQLNRNFSIALGKDDVESSAHFRQFARFDMDLIKNGLESTEVIQKIIALTDYKSLDEVIEEQIACQDPDEKFIYKILDRDQDNLNQEIDNRQLITNNRKSLIDQVQNRFLTIKVKR